MQSELLKRSTAGRFVTPSARAYWLLVTAIALPFWLLGLVPISRDAIPLRLPPSALVALAPLVAAVAVEGRAEGRRAVGRLLGRCVAVRGIGARWWLVSVIVMPAVLAASWLVQQALGRDLPAPNISPAAAAGLVVLFLVAALAEEAGWTGIALEPLLARLPVLAAAIVLGLGWSAWHLVPWLQTRPGVEFAAWQAFGSVALRVLMVWLYLAAGRRVAPVVVFHASVNVSEALFPVNGSLYDPAVTGALVAGLAAAVVALTRGAAPGRPQPASPALA